MTYSTLVSTDQLASMLDSCIVIDCRFDLANVEWGREEYLRAHVPGAVYAHLNDDLSAPPTGRNGRHPLPDVETLAATFGRFGIDRTAQVVVYDQDVGMYAARCWWMLRYLGHDAVALLDGGWAKWLREGRPVRRGEETRPATVFVPDVRPQMLVGVADVAAHLDDPRVLLVDARAPERFEGRTEPLDRVAGHIPGAAHHFFKSNVGPDGTMLPPETLRASLTAVTGGRPGDEVVMYCGSGVTACHNLLAMEHAGLHGARLYAGSWSEWSSDDTRPVETGPSSRSS